VRNGKDIGGRRGQPHASATGPVLKVVASLRSLSAGGCMERFTSEEAALSYLAMTKRKWLTNV
jgi:hypothetical protein